MGVLRPEEINSREIVMLLAEGVGSPEETRAATAALETSLVAQLESATGHAAELSPYTLDALLADAAATLSTLRQHIADLERRVAGAEKDSERLDAMFINAWWIGGETATGFCVMDCMGGIPACSKNAATPRDAIDAALDALPDAAKGERDDA